METETMGYRHCDSHDEDATNGCQSCEMEELNQTADHDVLRRCAYMLATDDDIWCQRLLSIADYMEMRTLSERREAITAEIEKIELRQIEMKAQP